MPQMLVVPEPCHEDWHAMTPNDRGRHCNQCDKTVIDFAAWQPEEILFYLKTNVNVCGHFRADQLEVPVPSPEDFVLQLVQMPISFFKRVAAIFLFVFGLMAGASCRQAPKANAPVMAVPVQLDKVVADTPIARHTVGFTAPVGNVQEPPHSIDVVRESYQSIGGAPVVVDVVVIDTTVQHARPLPPPYDSL